MILKTARLKRLFDELSPAEIFADIGCDHGYIAAEMLQTGKCGRAIVTDISEKCLEKAKALLEENFIGRFTAQVADGLKGVPSADEVLIAGMGGELIVRILKEGDFVPDRLVLQPMKNSDKVREYLVGNGYKIHKDYTFKDGKYYDIIVAERGKDAYTEDEITFGRDNLLCRNPDFLALIQKRSNELKSSLGKMGEKAAAEAEEKIKKYDGILNEIR